MFQRSQINKLKFAWLWLTYRNAVKYIANISLLFNLHSRAEIKLKIRLYFNCMSSIQKSSNQQNYVLKTNWYSWSLYSLVSLIFACSRERQTFKFNTKMTFSICVPLGFDGTVHFKFVVVDTSFRLVLFAAHSLKTRRRISIFFLQFFEFEFVSRLRSIHANGKRIEMTAFQQSNRMLNIIIFSSSWNEIEHDACFAVGRHLANDEMAKNNRKNVDILNLWTFCSFS